MSQSSESRDRTIYLVDGTYALFRAYHATPRLTTSTGLPTNAIYAFVQMLRKLIKDAEPDLVAVAFDTEAPTFRHEEYEEYKAHRPPVPSDLIEQMPFARRACEAMGIQVLEVDGYEADDVIATLAEKAKVHGLTTVIVTSDKDMFQLVEERVRIFNPVKNTMLDASKVEEVFGVPPDKVVEVLALWGDPTDNIPGVPGIGEKGAKDLIRTYGSIDQAREHLEEIKRKAYREGLKNHFAEAVRSRELATIRRDAPIEVDLERLERKPSAGREIRNLFSELEFTSLLQEETPAERKADDSEYRVLLDPADLKTLLKDARARGTLSLELETDGSEPMRARLVGLALSSRPGRGAYLPIGHTYLGAPRQPALEEILRTLEPLLTDPDLPKVGGNLKREMILLARHGLEVRGIGFDTMIASYLIDPGRGQHGLEALARDHLGHRTTSYKDVAGSGRNQVPLDQIDVEKVGRYAAENADVALRLKDALEPLLAEREMDELYQELEIPLVTVLAAMETAGVRVDPDVLSVMSRRFAEDLEKLESEIHELAGCTFNINSPKQLGEILFEQLELESKRRTAKTKARSTSMAVLEELAKEHPLPRKVLDYRSLSKLKSTYIDALPQLLNPETGRVHTSYNQTVAATGRLSSSDPNLQNIPARTPTGRRIRSAFVPDPGHRFLAADYSQVELRVMAHMADVPQLIEAFNQGEDIHRRTAAEIFHVEPGEVTSRMRGQAKTINFGVLYGMGPIRLAEQLGISRKEARSFIDAYFERFPGIKEYIDETTAQAERDGFVITLFNRRRYFPEIRTGGRMERQQALRAAVNTTIQGTAADLMKKAMLDLYAALRKEKLRSRMILQVHDELVLECPEDEIESVEPVVRQAMEGVARLRAPLLVDIKTGDSWEAVT